MNASTKPTVGYIGLGIMGGPMALHAREAGFPLVVHDVNKTAAAAHLAAGATWADSPRAVAEQCDAVFTCLPSLKIIEDVALGENGLLQGIRRDGAFFEMSTNSPELIKQLHAAFDGRGAHMLDAPISGGALGAKRGRLAIWVGGEKSAYDRFEKVLRAMGDHPVHVGGVGAGMVTKLVHNCASQSMQASLVEAFVLGVKAGADPLPLWEAIRQGSIGRRRSFDGLFDEFLPSRFEPPNAALKIVQKDLMIATELGRELGVPMRFANMALADIQIAMNRGWENRDARSVTLLPQERAGVAIKVDQAALDDVLRRDPAAPTDAKRGTGA